VLTIPENLQAVVTHALDPLGLDINVANSEQPLSSATFTAMQQRFDGAMGAVAYLLFILLYTPCVTAIAAIYRETSRNWTLFIVAWTSGIAYMTATLFYQISHYSQQPATALAWIIGLLLVFAAVLASLWWTGYVAQRTVLERS
jgi:ferrous iron transport protein B